MNKNTLVLIGLTLGVMAISAVLVYFRTETMSPPADLAKKGLSVLKRDNLIFFAVLMPVVIGLIALYVYRHWYANSAGGFLTLSIGIGVALTLLAAIFFKRALWEFTALHIAYIVAFGWLMPKLLV